MQQDVYNRLRDIVYEQSGIRIKDGKMSMVSSRIGKRLRTLNLEDELAYVKYLEGSMHEEVVNLLDVISTNVTSFFREPHHFVRLRELMEQWIAQGQRRFRVWSSACSTGEEPYTLAMVLKEIADASKAKLDIRILATDISTRVLAEAKEGIYSDVRTEGIAPHLRSKHMRTINGDDGLSYQMLPALKKMIVFRRMNLSQPPFPMKGPLDFVFCRNVMIYFDRPVRDGLVNEFHRLLRPDGYLMVGHSESLTQVDGMFSRDVSAVYRRSA